MRNHQCNRVRNTILPLRRDRLLPKHRIRSFRTKPEWCANRRRACAGGKRADSVSSETQDLSAKAQTVPRYQGATERVLCLHVSPSRHVLDISGRALGQLLSRSCGSVLQRLECHRICYSVFASLQFLERQGRPSVFVPHDRGSHRVSGLSLSRTRSSTDS